MIVIILLIIALICISLFVGIEVYKSNKKKNIACQKVDWIQQDIQEMLKLLKSHLREIK